MAIYEEQLAAAEARRAMVRRDVNLRRAEAGGVIIAVKITQNVALRFWTGALETSPDLAATNTAVTTPVTLLTRSQERPREHRDAGESFKKHARPGPVFESAAFKLRLKICDSAGKKLANGHLSKFTL